MGAETLVEVFLVPLRTWAKEDEVASKGQAAKAGSVAPAEVETIFGSIETLLHVNRALLAELRACGAGGSLAAARALAKTLADAAAGPLRFYAPHVQAFPGMCALLRRLLGTRPRLAAAARVLELQPRSKGLSLHSQSASRPRTVSRA